METHRTNHTPTSANGAETSGIIGVIKATLISDDVIKHLYTINLAIICAALCLFGIVTNILNIIVFISMKFKETTNIALLGLAISDICALFSLLWIAIGFNPLLNHPNIPVLSTEIQHATAGWNHNIFMRVTAFITMYITLERCLCIAFPLKIKQILTPKRVTVLIISIYVSVVGSLIPNFMNYSIAWKMMPGVNHTLLGVVYYDNRYVIQTVNYYFNVLYIMISFFVVIVCSIILIWKLKERTKWLGSASASAEKEKTSNSREDQIIKMVITVAVIFIVCFTPSVVLFLAMAAAPELNMGMRYENLFMVFATIVLTLNSINSSVNIFVYYRMSSRFKARFRALFCRANEKQQPS